MWIKDTVYSLLRLESGREVTADTDLEHDLGMDSSDIMNLVSHISDSTISLNSLSKVKTANDLIRAIVNSQENERAEWLRKAITAINAWRARQAQYKLL